MGDRPNEARVVTESHQCWEKSSVEAALGQRIRSTRIEDTADWADNEPCKPQRQVNEMGRSGDRTETCQALGWSLADASLAVSFDRIPAVVTRYFCATVYGVCIYVLYTPYVCMYCLYLTVVQILFLLSRAPYLVTPSSKLLG